MKPINRKQFLGGLGCVAAGTLAGAYIPGALVPDDSNVVTPPAPRPKNPVTPAFPIGRGQESYSQCGEDVNVHFNFKFLKPLKNSKITYMDVGAHHPVEINNTFYFYKMGFRGVLIEPNGAYCKMLRRARPEDATLEAGIGISAATEADYYLMNASALNTFSKEHAERIESETEGRFKIEEVRKIPLLNINDVMEKHFKGAPAFVSIDTEGLDLEILRTVDFTKYRPKVFCVETLITNTTEVRSEIAEYIESQNYTARGGSIVNTIFLDNALLD